MKQQSTRRIALVFAGILALAVLSCSWAVGIPNLFATETPTPTNTFTPSPTLTPSPTSTPTETPSPTPMHPSSGVWTEEQPDGSTLFVDNDNKYQLVLPAGWVVLPLSSRDMADIIEKMSVENPDFKQIAEAFKNLDPDVIRVMALNKDRKYLYKSFSTNLSVTALDQKVLSAMPLDFVTGAIEESVKQQGGQVLSTGSTTFTNANGVEMGKLEFEQTAPTAAGDKIQVRTQSIVFQTNGKVVIVQLATPKQFEEELAPGMDGISDSIKLIEP